MFANRKTAQKRTTNCEYFDAPPNWYSVLLAQQSHESKGHICVVNGLKLSSSFFPRVLFDIYTPQSTSIVPSFFFFKE
jgi:hypothetical protein